VEVGVGGEYVTCVQRSRAGSGGRRLMWRRQRDGGQGFAYNTNEMINGPRFNGRTRKIITVAQSDGALHEVRAGRAECPQQVQGLTQRTQNAPSERFVC
jgi:hypothetical protein